MRTTHVVCSLSLDALFAAVVTGALPSGTIMTTGTAHSHSVSIPVSQMPACSPEASLPPLSPEPEAVPLIRTNSTTSSSAPGPTVSFEGINLAQERGTRCREFSASDDSGVVGPSVYMQVVNYGFAVYDKAGGRLLAGPIATQTFWLDQPDCGGDQFWTDSVVLYDRRADRWVMSRPGGLPAGADLCLAISQTPDPLGSWDQYAFAVNNTANGLSEFFNDYPKIAVWTDAYYAVADPDKIFSGRGNTITAFDRAAMVAGNAAPAFVTFFVPAPPPFGDPPQPAHSHMQAANLEGPTQPPARAPEYVVQVQDRHYGFPKGRLQVYEFQANWSSPSASTLTATTSLKPKSFNTNVCTAQQVCITQPDNATQLDSLAYGYMMYRLTYRNFGDHEMILFNHTVAANGKPKQDHAGIRWYELRKKGNRPWSIFQQGTYAPDSNDRWLGTMAMDGAGNIALGFDVAGESMFPSVHYAGRLRKDPKGRLSRGEAALIDGNGVQQTTPFYGDYSEMTIDPTDDCTFWLTNTYYPATSTPNEWHTRIGAFRFRSCVPEAARVPK
jgi:hypothetical protein